MLKIENDIGRIKHEVLYEVAKYTFAGEPEEKLEQIPYELIPGPKPQFRCCIYREREIIRERVRLAQGKSPVGSVVIRCHQTTGITKIKPYDD